MSEIATRAVQSEDEYRSANDLIFEVFRPELTDGRQELEYTGRRYPGFRLEHTRAAFWRGELAAALRVISDTIRLGEARLKTGGIAFVATYASYRNKGVARALIDDTLQYLRQHNYHVAMLFGIPGFYHQFGFTTAIADYNTYVDTDEACHVEAGQFRVRPGKPGDIRAVQRMHDVDDEQSACSIIRNAAHISARWEQWKSLEVLTDKHGRVMAYFVPHLQGHRLRVDEVGTLDRSCCPPLLRAVGDYARELEIKDIQFGAPPHHPFVEFLHGIKSRHETDLHRGGGGMMAFIDIAETLESMVPEWESRLAQRGMRSIHAEVTLIVGTVPYRIRAHRGAVDVSEESGANKFSVTEEELMHLVTGYRYLNDIAGRFHRALTPTGWFLLETFFPKRTPFLWPLDRF